MSLASDYATAIAAQMSGLATVEATKPAPWVGPGGLVASVNDNGTISLQYGQLTIPNVPPLVALAFRDWLTNTLT